ncbi:MAG: DUF488 domain-containing protein [bacterium]
MKIFTVGHSNGTFEDLAVRIEKYGIQTIVDVRSAPFSKYVPHFNHEMIEKSLTGRGTKYVYMGDRLGGRPKDPALCGADGKPDYDKIAADDRFVEGLEILKGIAQWSTVCILCSEANPSACHRSKLISKQLTLQGVEVAHILGDGSLETEKEIAKRRASSNENQLELF